MNIFLDEINDCLVKDYGNGLIQFEFELSDFGYSSKICATCVISIALLILLAVSRSTSLSVNASMPAKAKSCCPLSWIFIGRSSPYTWNDFPLKFSASILLI